MDAIKSVLDTFAAWVHFVVSIRVAPLNRFPVFPVSNPVFATSTLVLQFNVVARGDIDIDREATGSPRIDNCDQSMNRSFDPPGWLGPSACPPGENPLPMTSADLIRGLSLLNVLSQGDGFASSLTIVLLSQIRRH